MIRLKSTYTTRELRDKVADYIDQSPTVLDFSLVTEYLTTLGVEFDKKKSGVEIGGPILGVLVESKPKRLEKIMISTDVYRQLFNREPTTEAVKGLYKVYVSTKYPEKINEVKELQEKSQLKANMEKGITPLFTGKIIDFRLLEILQEACRTGDLLDEVMIQKIKNYEREAREIMGNANQEIENIITRSIAQLYAKYEPLSKELKGIKEKIDETRKKVHKESASLESSAH